MRLTLWVTALAVLSLAWAKNSTAKAKPKRQLESIRSPQNLQYSLVLPHSRVSHFRSLNDNRRISYGPTPRGKLPPYAVQMEPVVQYSQKDPLYDPTLENLDDYVNKNEIYVQPQIVNGGDQTSHESRYGEPYGSLPTAPLYSHEPQPHYYEAPEPIIEIIIKESNESLPAPPPAPVIKKKKEPVQVFYVKYSKDPHSHDKVVYEKPIPAITPPTNDEDEHEHHEEYVTVTPEPYYVQPQTTTLRAIIKPDSEVYHSDSSVKVTFGKEPHHSHYSDRREGNGNNEDHEETAPRPAIAFPQQPLSHPPLERSAQPSQQFHDSAHRTQSSHKGPQNYRPIQPPQQHAQSRIQFQPPYIANEQQLPRQGPSIAPFRGPIARQNPFPTPLAPTSNFPGPLAHFPNNAPTLPGPITPAFPTNQPRPNIVPTFHPRPNSQPPFGPRPLFSGPPRPSFHSGPQRPFNQPPQTQPFFDEAKYLQENYHTITTEQVEPPKDQPLPSRPSQSFNFIPKPSPSPTPSQFQEHYRPQQHIPLTQLLPQQRPHQQFVENTHNRPTFAVTPSRSPFYNLKPSPPHIEENHSPFQQPTQQHQQPNSQFSFHQGVQSISRPSQQIPQQNQHHRFPGPISPSASPIPQTQFLPQSSSTPQFNFQPQPSPIPDHFQHNSPSERPPQFHQFNNPQERPIHHHQSNFQDQSNLQHQQNVGQFVPNGGELVAAIPKYEQHITVNGPTAQPDYSSLGQSSQPSTSPSNIEQQYRQQQEQQRQIQEQQRQQYFEQEQEQVRQQLAQNVKKQQEEIQKLQSQLIQAQNQRHQQQHHEQHHEQHQQQHQQQQQQQQHEQQQQQQQYQQQQQQQHQQQQQQQQQQHRQQQHQQLQKQQQEAKQYEIDYRQLQNNYNQQNVEVSSARPQYNQERSRPINYQSTYPTSTASAPYYQSTSRTVEIKPTTQKYASSTINSINTASEEKEQKKKKPTIELPDEVPDDLRQQLLSSGILDNADISVLDYDKVGETPLESLPPDQLANFFSAGGGQQIAASENRPIVVTPNGEKIQSRIDEDEEDDDQEIAASENIPQYAMPAPQKKQAVEMKVVHFDPTTKEGQKVATDYVKDDATRLEPVALNDKKYNRYLPLKVSGNQFPLPDILKGRIVTSVVVLAPVETELINQDEHARRSKRATSNNLKGIKFVAGESLQDLLKRPTKENYEKWLKTEKNTAADLQSVVLLVTGRDDAPEEREIFMYDVSSGNVNKLDGELSNAFVEAAENNSLSKDIERLAIEGDGVPENFDKIEDETVAEGSENVPLLVDLSGLSLDQENSNQVSISSGYSKTKLGRSLQKH